MACAVHIQRNVQQKFGIVAAGYVNKIAKTYSRRQENPFFQQLNELSPRAEAYLKAIPANTWRSTCWTAGGLPPRFGITSSNMAESLNSMFEDARSCCWLVAIDRIIDKITTRTTKLREEVAGENSENVVPQTEQIIRKLWNSSAACQVVLIQQGDPRYKVKRGAVIQGLHQVSHVIDVSKKSCSCGQWQDFGIPCLDAIAYYRHVQEKELGWVVGNAPKYLHGYACQKAIVKKNLIPVVIDNLELDNKTEPASPAKRPRGRPKTKRLRKRSRFAEPVEESPIVCGTCGLRGHNKRTCERRQNMSEEGANEDVL